MSPRALVGPLLALALAATACGRDPLVESTPKGLKALAFDPSALTLYAGQSFRFDVTLERQGERRSLLESDELELGSSDPKVVAIAGPGEARAVSEGRAQLEARYRGLGAVLEVEVLSGKLIALEVEPTTIELAVGERQSITVWGVLDSGSRVDLSAGRLGTSYAVRDPAVAKIDADGRVDGIAEGSTEIRIDHGELTASLRVIVTRQDPELVRIWMAPEAASLEYGDALALRVFGALSDGREVGLPRSSADRLRFSSSDPGLAQVSTDGRVQAFWSSGTAFIDVELNGLRARSTIEIHPPARELVRIEASPRDQALVVGGRGQLRVTGFYADGGTVDITRGDQGTRYRSSNPGVVEVSPDGLLGALRAGEATVEVAHGSFGDRARVVVIDQDVLTGIRFEPASLALFVGEAAPVRVLGTLQSGLEVDVTASTQLSSSSPAIVSVSPGLVIALSQGSAFVSARFSGFEALLRVTVEDQLVGLFIDPPEIWLAPGEQAGFSVLGQLRGGGIVDLTFAGVDLRIDDPGVAGLAGPGMVIGWAPGQTMLTALHRSSGLMATALVLVMDQQSELLELYFFGPRLLSVGETAEYQVVGRFSDGSFQDLTQDPGLLVASRDPNIVALSSSGPMMRAVSPGGTVVTVDFLGIHLEAEIVVRSSTDRVIALEWVPSELTLAAGDTGYAWLSALLSSGRTLNVTFDPRVTGTVSGPIDLFPGPNGDAQVIALAPGFGSVQAELEGMSAVLSVFVTPGNGVLVGIELLLPPMLSVGEAAPYSVIARYSDGSSADISFDPNLQLSSAPAGIVDLLPGRIVGLAQGQATIEVFYQGMVSSATIAVVDSQILRVFWRPRQLRLQVGEQRAIGLFVERANGFIQEVTFDPQTTITSAGPVQLIPGGGRLRVEGLAPGGPGGVWGSFGGSSATLPIMVRN